METPSRSAALDVELEDFIRHARQYSFFQANRLIERYCELNRETHTEQRFRGKTSLAFPVADIDYVHCYETPVGRQIEIAVTFMGLYGPSSPLPAFYTERLLHSDDESEAMRQLFDLINHRLIQHVQMIWEKYRYYIQYSRGRDRLSQWVCDLAGILAVEQLEAMGLHWPRLLKLAPLLAIKVRNPRTLQSLLEGYFKGVRFEIEECVERSVSIPQDQQHAMGMNNGSLGIDLVMGDTVQDRIGKFRLHITDFGSHKPEYFYTGGRHARTLSALVEFFLRDQFAFDLCIHRPPVSLKDRSMSGEGARVGWNSVLGDSQQAVEQVLVACG